ncbi:RNA polymerase sigma factor [Rothia sp. P5764]|uniref:RNA polymerase sigma factor n=1 Tax=Rothia sp. P5764 TaxID=3402654 RepID=UPI003ACA2297
MTYTQTGAARAWTPEMLKEWQNTIYLIRARLTSSCPAHDAHDVHQNTWLAAHQRLDSYDPSKGPFGPWIRSVAITEVKTYQRKKITESQHSEAYNHLANTGVSETLSLVEEDIAKDIIEEDGNYTRLHHVMGILATVMENPAHLERTLKIILAFDGNVAAASRALGIAPKTLRDNQANTVRLAQVIHRALDAHERLASQGGNISEILTVEDLLGCLPMQETHLPTGFGVLVSMIATGTELNTSAIEALGEQLGISYSLSRNYYNQTLKLLSVAKLVIDRGLAVYQ